MQKIWHADRRQKQNHKEEKLLGFFTRWILILRSWIIEESDSSSSSRKTCSSRRWWSKWILDNQRQSSRTFSCLVIIGLTTRGRKPRQERERKQENIPVLYCFVRSNIVLPSSSRSIQDAVSLIVICRTVLFSRAASSSTFIMSDVQSICIPSSIRDCYLEVKNWATDSILSACGSHGQKPQGSCYDRTWINRVMQNTCIQHGRDIRTQYIGSTSILLWGKGWHSIRLDRTLPFFTKHAPVCCIPKVVRMENGEVESFYCHLGLHQRSFWNTNWCNSWVQLLLNDQRDQFFNNLKVLNRVQPNPNPDHE